MFLPSRPKIDPHDVRRVLKALGSDAQQLLEIIAIRGYWSNSFGKPGNDRDGWDDALCMALSDHCLFFPGNTDPSGWRPQLATLVPGSYHMIPGKHKVNSPTGYPAFRQFGPVTVTRDGQGDKHFTGNFGINNHVGGRSTTGSAGCQTIPPMYWEEYRRAAYTALGVTDEIVMANKFGVTGKQFAYHLLTLEEWDRLVKQEA